MKSNYKSICVLILALFIILLQFSCTIRIFEIEEGSKLLEDGLWRLYIDGIGFGKNVDIYNNTAIVSASNDTTASVHVFEYNDNGEGNWELKASLSEENASLDYGTELVLFDNVIAISDCEANKIYTYVKSDTTWEKTGFIIPPVESNFTDFGRSLDIYDNYLIIGSKTGPAVLYELISNNWYKLESLDVGDEQENEYEIQVSISENFLATCKGRDIYVYNRVNANLSNRTLIDSINNSNHDYNYRINLDDSTLVVGDPAYANNHCAIILYGFESNSWKKDTTIQHFIEREEFGNKVEICSDHILFSILPMDYFSSNYFAFYELGSTKQWVHKESISRSSYRSNFALSNEFAIISGLMYTYIYKYK